MERSTTLSVFLALCRSFVFPAPWSDLRLPPCFHTLTNGEEALAALLERCTTNDLLDAGLVQEANGTVSLLPGLVGADGLFLLQHDSLGKPAGLFTAYGWGAVACSDLANEISVEDCSNDPLVVTGSRGAWALLIALGIRATVATELTRDQMGYLDASGFGSTSASAEPREEIVLAGWDPISLSLTSNEFRPLAESLLEAEFHGEADLSHLAVWRPSSQVLDAVRLALRSGEVGTVAELLRSSTRDDLFTLGQLCPDLISADSALSYDIAYHALESEQIGHPADQNAGRLAQAARDYERSVHEELVMPLVKEAMQQADPLLKSRLVMLSLCAKAYYQAAPFVGRTRPDGSPGPSVTENLKLLQQFSTMVKQIDREGLA